MIKFHKSEEFIGRLRRINSPIATYLLKKRKLDDTLKEHVNYISVSRDNPMFISYLDRSKMEKIPEGKIQEEKPDWTICCTAKLYKEAFRENAEGERISMYTFNGVVDCDIRAHSYDFPTRYFKGAAVKEWEVRFKRNTILHRLLTPDIKDWGDLFRLIKTVYTERDTDEYIMRITDPVRRYVFDVTNLSIDSFKYINPGISTVETYPRWESSNRIHASAGKVIKRIIGIKNFSQLFSDKTLEDFVAQYKFQACKEVGGLGQYLYEEFSGEKIRWAYHEENYFSKEGTLGNSCMRYAVCQQYFDLYTLNERYISLGTLMKDGKIVARCLLWYPNTKSDNDHRFFDRIYSMDDESSMLMRSFMEKSGFKNCYGDSYNVEPIKFQLDYHVHHLHKWPYMDSMKYYLKKGFLANDPHIIQSKERALFILTATNGLGPAFDDGKIECPCCLDRFKENNMVTPERGLFRRKKICADCTTVNPRWGTISIKDIVKHGYTGEELWFNDAVQIFNGKLVNINEIKSTYDGEYYYDDDDVIADVSGNIHLKRDEGRRFIKFKDQYHDVNGGSVYAIRTQAFRYKFVHIESEEYKEFKLKELKEQEEKIKENERKSKELPSDWVDNYGSEVYTYRSRRSLYSEEARNFADYFYSADAVNNVQIPGGVDVRELQEGEENVPPTE